MRIDKFLKIARILKKRPIAKQLAVNERLFINDRLAKASSEVKEGDVVRVVFGKRSITFRVNEILKEASKQEALGMYEILAESNEEIEV